ncbi:MAG: pyruvate ferredoxin oxidoreductase [Methanomassiliicoccus sp.]|nr:pyruvate ferredoxin oxidoreductase [Methanomassiliicoccus sp.]
MIEMMTANYAAAHAARLARVDVTAVYPITPQTSISEKLAEMVQKGEMDAKFMMMESEHSAMSALIGASYAGARTFTATSSHGLALMHEMLMWAVGARRPVVMPVAARAIGGPWNIWGEHQDVITERDTGWLQIFCENNQEVLDTVLMAYRVAEDPQVMLPVMVIEDGFILSHTVDIVDIPSQEEVDRYLPPFRQEYPIDVNRPMRHGGLVMPDWWTEFRHRIYLSQEIARDKLAEAEKAFQDIFGRSYGGMMEHYRCEDADAVLVVAGSAAGTAKEVADRYREDGKKVGVAKMRVFRPFPAKETRQLGDMTGTIGVFDRSYTFGDGGAMFNEVRSALMGYDSVMKNYVGGLGGRDVTVKHMEWIFDDLLRISVAGKADRQVEWVGLKDGSGRW